MSETTCGDHEGQASPSEGASTQGTPEPAPEQEVIEVALGTTPIPYLSVRTLGAGLDTLHKFEARQVRRSILTRVSGIAINEIPGFRYEPGDDLNTLPKF